jgi:uncharacterized membrane protein
MKKAAKNPYFVRHFEFFNWKHFFHFSQKKIFNIQYSVCFWLLFLEVLPFFRNAVGGHFEFSFLATIFLIVFGVFSLRICKNFTILKFLSNMKAHRKRCQKKSPC